MNSLPTTESANLEKYWDIVRQLEPEFYLLRIALKETGVNPLILPKIIRGISNIAIGTGYGKVTTYISKGSVTKIDSLEADTVEQVIINVYSEKESEQ